MGFMNQGFRLRHPKASRQDAWSSMALGPQDRFQFGFYGSTSGMYILYRIFSCLELVELHLFVAPSLQTSEMSYDEFCPLSQGAC